MTVEEHAAAVAGEPRKHKEIEEVIGCSLCGGRRVQPLLHPFDRRRTPPRWNYHVVRCVGCGFLFRHPGIRAERLGDLYASDYSGFLGGKYTRRRKQRYRVVLKAFRPLFAYGDGRRLLDFGCGNGLFLEIARKRGFDGYGVDLAADAVEVARRRGLKAFHGDPADIPEIAAGGFDVITMWSVLAHLPHPVDDLTKLRSLLSDDGVLLILTVNANSLALKRHRERWKGFTPNHLKFFAPDTLPLLLRRAGFGAVAFRPWYGDALESGRSRMTERDERRLREVVDRGNRGNMMRAVAFADPAGPEQWGLEDLAVAL